MTWDELTYRDLALLKIVTASDAVGDCGSRKCRTGCTHSRDCVDKEILVG
jgi:hypothetical protein